jgi:hypothetical protein
MVPFQTGGNKRHRRARGMRTCVLRAVALLESAAKETPVSTLRPWAEFVLADQADFEKRVLYPNDQPQSSIAFIRPHDWTVARLRENA